MGIRKWTERWVDTLRDITTIIAVIFAGFLAGLLTGQNPNLTFPDSVTSVHPYLTPLTEGTGVLFALFMGLTIIGDIVRMRSQPSA